MPRSNRTARKEEFRSEPAEERAVLLPSFFEPTTMSWVSRRSSAAGTKERSTEQIHVERDQEGMARAADELPEGEPDAALREVKETSRA